MTQRALFNAGPASEVSLTDRQREALAILRDAHPEGLTSFGMGIEFGGQTYARSTGLALLQALKKKGLARQGRAGVFYAVIRREPGELPEGF